MFRFQPAVEPLDVRTLPSAVLARPDQPAGHGSPATVTIDANEIQVAKVTANGFSFTTKVTKSSPG